MEVKNIIKKVCNLISDEVLLSAIESGTFTEEQQKDINLLVECVNLTNINIATNYVKLIDVVSVDNYSGQIYYQSISQRHIFNILSVKNERNKEVDFEFNGTGISADKGKIKIKFTYFPEDVDFYDEIKNYPMKISERDFVYGVLSEYLYAKGVFDEAKIWEERFKNEMQSKMRNQKQINMRVSRWT